MTTIILVAIGVLIAATSALALLYFGGDAFGVNEIRADAGRLVSEGAQIQYATDLFYRERGVMPGNGSGPAALNELVSEKYLQSVPQGVFNADGSSQSWTMDYGSDGMIYSKLYSIAPLTDTNASKADKSGAERGMAVCKEARRQLKYEDVVPAGGTGFEGQTVGELAVYKCDGSNYPRSHPTGTLPDREPCCIR